VTRPTCGRGDDAANIAAMTRPLLLLATLLTTTFACGGDDDDDNDTGADTGSASDPSTTSPSTSNTSSTTSTEEVCDSSHMCVGASCVCTTPGLENMACTDDTACEEECEICM
jgi:hypothetical protein